MQEVSGSIPLGSTIHLIWPGFKTRYEFFSATLADEVSPAGVFGVLE